MIEVSKCAIFAQKWSKMPTIFLNFFLSLWTILLCIVGEKAGRWYVAVAVGVSVMWKVTCARWHVPGDMWHATNDTWHLTCYTFLYLISFSSSSYFFQILFLQSYYPHTLRYWVSPVWGISNCFIERKIVRSFNVFSHYFEQFFSE